MTDQIDLADRMHTWLAAFNRRDLDEYLSFYADDIVLHGYTPEPLAPSGVRDYYDTFLNAFEVASVFDEEIWDGERVAIRWTCHALQVADFGDITPSGKRVSWPGLSLMHWKNGKISERWSIQDMSHVESVLMER